MSRRRARGPTARRCRATGTVIIVGNADDLGFSADEGGAWAALCDEHGEFCQFETRKLAEYHAAWPEWCSGCQKILYASEGE